jgi:hypothetical protein
MDFLRGLVGGKGWAVLAVDPALALLVAWRRYLTGIGVHG